MQEVASSSLASPTIVQETMDLLHSLLSRSVLLRHLAALLRRLAALLSHIATLLCHLAALLRHPATLRNRGWSNAPQSLPTAA